MFGYRVPKPDQVMLISGRKSTETEPFKISRQGKWVVPGFRVARFLSLSQQRADVDEPCTTIQGIDGNFKAVVAFHIANDDQAIYAAGQRFLDDQGVDKKTGVAAMVSQTGGIFAGHLRSIVGAMTLEEISQQRQKLADQVLDASKIEVGRMGLEIDSFQLTSIEGEQVKKYIAALAAPHSARIQQEAAIAQAEAERAAAEAQQLSARQQAEYERDTRLKQAEYKAATDKAEAEAAQAGPLAQSLAEQQVLETKRETAQKNAALVEQQLVAQVERPAQAEAKRMKIIAGGAADQAEEEGRQMRLTAQARADSEVAAATGKAREVELSAAAEAKATEVKAVADAKATEINGNAEASSIRATKLAEAAGQLALNNAVAAGDRVQLEMARVQATPEVARAIASGFHESTITVLNGADGMAQLVNGVAQQARALIETFTKPNGQVTNGHVTDGDAATSVSKGLADLAASADQRYAELEQQP
jgi:flotillin